MDRRLRYSLVGAGIVLLALAAYWRVLGNDFITYYDDGSYVVKNPHVQAGLTAESIRWAFTTTSCANWHPLTWISHMIDYRLFGLKPMGHHLVNLLFHLANTLLLLLILTRMTGSLWKSAFVAALFAVHPLHVESVAWVAERKDVLSTFFWFLTLGAYVLYAEKPGLKRYLPVAVLYALGLMAKPMLVTLPLTLLLLDYWPLGRTDRKWRLVWEKLPLLAMAAGSSIATLIAQNRGQAMSGLNAFPLTMRINNALISYVKYGAKALWPAKLCVFYPHPRGSLSLWIVAASAILLAGISALIFTAARKKPYMGFGWMWFLITLLPVIGIVQVGLQSMADRYTYVPLIGLFVMVSWGVSDLLKYRKALAVTACLIVAVLAVMTWIQVGYWQNGITLFTHAVDVTEDNYMAHENLGLLFSMQGKLDDAVEHYGEAVAIRPDWDEGYFSLGKALDRHGDVEEAIQAYEETLRLNPGYIAARTNLAADLMKTGRVDEALQIGQEAAATSPDSADLHYNMGCALEKQGKYGEAMKEYQEAVRLRPDFGLAHNNLAVGYFFQGRFAEAWKEAHLAEKYGMQPNQSFLKALSQRMPDPGS